MSRTIYCSYLKEEAQGLDFQFYPGELGKKIYNEISKAAWDKWIKVQTMLINEHKLSMMNPDHRKQIEEQMIAFLFEGKEIIINKTLAKQ